jgi:tetratricopeptide (TPR) repeat protein
MKSSFPFHPILCLLVFFPAVAGAADIVKTADSNYSGTIVEIGARGIDIDRNGTVTEIPANEIEYARFDNEPPLLGSARTAIRGSRYEDAVEALKEIDPADLKRKGTRHDYQYYIALTTAQLALSGAADLETAAGKMANFISQNQDSYHYIEALKLAGELYLAAEDYDQAKKYFQLLTQAPWPDSRLKAQNALGNVLLLQGEIEQAQSTFQKVIDDAEESPLVERQKQFARIGLAKCLAGTQDASQAVTNLHQVIDNGNPEDAPLMAEAYNALGSVRTSQGRPTDAILAYLHVDLLYATARIDHIEALKHLAKLWKDVQRPDRAAEAAEILENRYGISQ